MPENSPQVAGKLLQHLVKPELLTAGSEDNAATMGTLTILKRLTGRREGIRIHVTESRKMMVIAGGTEKQPELLCVRRKTTHTPTTEEIREQRLLYV